MNTLRLIGNKILIKADDPEEKRESGLIIPDTAQKPVYRGVVVATGPGSTDAKGVFHPCLVEPGDRVVYGKFSGTEMEYKEQKLLIMMDNDVYFIIDGEDENTMANDGPVGNCFVNGVARTTIAVIDIESPDGQESYRLRMSGPTRKGCEELALKIFESFKFKDASGILSAKTIANIDLLKEHVAQKDPDRVKK